MPKRVEANLAVILEKIDRGNFIEVTWIDASQSKAVNTRKLPLPNHNVETQKVTNGIFVCVQRGETWRDDHLILAFEETDGFSEVVSIPIAIVKIIRYAKTKRSKKTTRSKKEQQFSDGSVKIFA